MTLRTIIKVTFTDGPASNEAARAMQRAVDGTDAGSETFTEALYPVSAPENSTPSHLWACITLSPEIHNEVEAMLLSFEGSEMADYDLDSNPGFPSQFLAARGLRTALSLIP